MTETKARTCRKRGEPILTGLLHNCAEAVSARKRREARAELGVGQEEFGAPSERQMRLIRAQYPDHILLFEHGSESYRAYGTDAEECFRAVGATSAADVFSTSRTLHDLERLIKTLVDRGHKVAMCDRVGSHNQTDRADWRWGGSN